VHHTSDGARLDIKSQLSNIHFYSRGFPSDSTILQILKQFLKVLLDVVAVHVDKDLSRFPLATWKKGVSRVEKKN
jgi:hypothetical protein